MNANLVREWNITLACQCHWSDVEVSERDNHLCVFTHVWPSVAEWVDRSGHTITLQHWVTLIFYQQRPCNSLAKVRRATSHKHQMTDIDIDYLHTHLSCYSHHRWAPTKCHQISKLTAQEYYLYSALFPWSLYLLVSFNDVSASVLNSTKHITPKRHGMKRFSVCVNLFKRRSRPEPFLIYIYIFVSTSEVIDLVFSCLCSFFLYTALQREWFLPMFNIWWYWSECWWKTPEQYLFQPALHPRQKFNNIPLSWIFEVTISTGRGLRRKVGWCGKAYTVSSISNYIREMCQISCQKIKHWTLL